MLQIRSTLSPLSLRAVTLATASAVAMAASTGAASLPAGGDSDVQVDGTVQAGGGGVSQGGDFTAVGSIGQLGTTAMHGGDFDFSSGVLSSEEPMCVLADFDCDGFVNGADLGVLLLNWGACPTDARCIGDLNRDGNVNGADLGTLMANWN